MDVFAFFIEFVFIRKYLEIQGFCLSFFSWRDRRRSGACLFSTDSSWYKKLSNNILTGGVGV